MDHTATTVSEHIAADKAVLAAEGSTQTNQSDLANQVQVAARTMPASRLSEVTADPSSDPATESQHQRSAGSTATVGLAMVAGAVVVSSLVNASREDATSGPDERRQAREQARTAALVAAAIAIPMTLVAVSSSEPGSTRLRQHDAVMTSGS